jgi:hypothetical protein
MVCGPNVKHWNGYLFVDDEDDDEEDEDDDHQDEEQEEDEDGDQPLEKIGEDLLDNPVIDLIAGASSVANRCDNPREYFLMILRVQIFRISVEWGEVVRAVESGVETRSDEYPCLSASSLDRNRQKGDVESTLRLTIDTLGLLRKFQSLLLYTTKEWEDFKDPERGYYSFFSDLIVDQPTSKSETHIYRTFLEIDGEYKEIEKLQPRIESLINRCTTYQDKAQFHLRSLELQLALDNSKAAQESSTAARETSQAAQKNGSATEFMILAISPVGVVTAFFNIPNSVIPWVGRTSTSFVWLMAVVAVVFWALLWVARNPQKLKGWLVWVAEKMHRT